MKKEKKNKQSKNTAKNYETKGYAVNFDGNIIGREVFNLIKNYSITGEIQLTNSRLVSKTYNYIVQNKKDLINDNGRAVCSANLKAIFARFLTGSGVFSYITTLIIFFLNLGMVDLSSIFMMAGLGALGSGFVYSSSLLHKSNNTEIIENLLRDMEDKYGVECLSEKTETEMAVTTGLSVSSSMMEDKFLDEIKTIVNHAGKNRDLDFSHELSALDNLTKCYIAEKRESIRFGKEIRRYDFLNELTKIEIKMFSKKNTIGLKQAYLLSIRGYQLVERLKFMGLSEATITEDVALSNVFNEIARISKTPYEGCERELVELFRIAQEYCRRTYPLKDPSVSRLPVVENPASQLLRELARIQDVVTTHINMAMAASKKPLLQGEVSPTMVGEEFVAKTI